MNARPRKTKLRIVEGCPQPDPPPYREIQYGFAGGHKVERLAPMPLPHEISVRARAQSILSRDGKRAELPDYETALKIIAEANKPKRDWNVTVPKPRTQTSK